MSKTKTSNKINMLMLLAGLLMAGSLLYAEEKNVGDHSDGSSCPAVHVISLYDEEGTEILTSDDPMLPFSTKQTCGQCHDYDAVSQGWHFNSNNPDVNPGRPGQPWILVDHETATQVPLSYRSWPGVFNPDIFGVTPWQFAKLFGRQLPGNISEDDETEIDYDARWFVSGRLEINCLACHNADPAYDQSEYAIQIFKENFRWAIPASTSLATMTGSAKDMPDMYDYLLGDILDDPKLKPPTIAYNKNKFDDASKVFFDVSRKIPNERCYFCHSNSDVMGGYENKWTSDEDVHVEAGLNCVDCHNNGKDHMIVRGYHSEPEVSDNPKAASSSCRACHLGREHSDKPIAGRLAAPEPEHKGIPVVHFDKLTCTACHSGPWPEEETKLTQTSRAHGLGVHGLGKTDAMLPHVYYPVYMRNSEGKIGPHKIVWPAYWADMTDETIEPLKLELVKKYISGVLAKKQSKDLNWPELTEDLVIKGLSALKAEQSLNGTPVYIAGGKVYSLDKSSQLLEKGHTSAQPVSWPIAHNVRPASQSLGVRKCEDCHSVDSPFIFGLVNVDNPIADSHERQIAMSAFAELDDQYMSLFASSFVFRPFLKVLGLAVSFLIGMVILYYGLRALGSIINFFDENAG